MNRKPALLALAALAAAALPALAQQTAGDPALGRNLAKSLCADCHQVDIGDEKPSADAPGFPDVAALPSTTALSLRVFLQSNHRSMPNYQLAPEQIDHVIAFILSLKAK